MNLRQHDVVLKDCSS